MSELDRLELGRLISNQTDSLAEECISAYYERNPNYQGRTNISIRSKSLQDFKYHLHYVAESIIAGQTVLFLDYVDWVRNTLTNLGLDETAILQSFIVLFDILDEFSSPYETSIIDDIRNAVLLRFNIEPSKETSYLETTPFQELAQAYLQALLAGNRNLAGQLILNAVDSAEKVAQVYLHVFQPVLKEVGRLWQFNIVSVAQEHYCTASTQMIMSQLYPYIFSTQKSGKVMVAACAGGELHEIGMRMVTDFFEMASWDTFYLGANVPPSTIADTLIERNAGVLGISATMTYHLKLVREMIEIVRSSPECRQVKILVGGQPFNKTNSLWEAVGADGYASGPLEAVNLAEKWI